MDNFRKKHGLGAPQAKCNFSAHRRPSNCRTKGGDRSWESQCDGSGKKRHSRTEHKLRSCASFSEQGPLCCTSYIREGCWTASPPERWVLNLFFFQCSLAMDKLPVDAMQKVLQFVGVKDCVGLAQTNKQLRNDVHMQRFQLFTEILFNAKHPDWGCEGGVYTHDDQGHGNAQSGRTQEEPTSNLVC